MSRSTSRLETSLNEHFVPVLLADGFSGYGGTFRRVLGDFVNIVQVVESEHGWEFAVHLGVQPLTIRDVYGDPPDPRTLTEERCEFRRRLADSAGDHRWPHDGSTESIDQATRAAATTYAIAGRMAFLALCGPDSPLRSITPDEFEAGSYNFSGFGSTKVRMAVAIALMRSAAGRGAAARAFARIGLDLLPPSSSSMRRSLEALCAVEDSADVEEAAGADSGGGFVRDPVSEVSH